MTQTQRINAKWETIYCGQDLYVGSKHIAAEGYGIRVKKSEKCGYGEEFIVIPSAGNELAIMQQIVGEHNMLVTQHRCEAKNA